jgi:malonate decarboxylase delta subunit
MNMNTFTTHLERMRFCFQGVDRVPDFEPLLVGVVGSGNLEVLAQPGVGNECEFLIETSARGFSATWEAVLTAFHGRYPLAGVRLSINDMGATPAVVTLRLQQAVAGIL